MLICFLWVSDHALVLIETSLAHLNVNLCTVFLFILQVKLPVLVKVFILGVNLKFN